MQFQRKRILKNFSEAHTVKKVSLFDEIKLFLTILVELHPRNISAKFYQNWPAGFGGEDFYKKLLTDGADGRTDGRTTDDDRSQYLTLALRAHMS